MSNHIREFQGYIRSLGLNQNYILTVLLREEDVYSRAIESLEEWSISDDDSLKIDTKEFVDVEEISTTPQLNPKEFLQIKTEFGERMEFESNFNMDKFLDVLNENCIIEYYLENRETGNKEVVGENDDFIEKINQKFPERCLNFIRDRNISKSLEGPDEKLI